MTIKPVFAWFRGRFKKWYEPDPRTTELLKSLAKADRQTVSCDDVLMVLGHFADAIRRGENVLLFMPLIREHLDVCPACREEYESLLQQLQPKSDT
jgi:hypothetical protein